MNVANSSHFQLHWSIREQEETGAGYISPSLSLQSSLRLAVLPTDRMLLFRVSADFPHPSLQALCLNRKGCCFQVPTAPRSPLSPTQFVVAPFINKPSSFYPIWMCPMFPRWDPNQCMWNITCEWKMLPALSSNNGCCGHQTISHYRCPQWCTLRGFRMEKSRIWVLDS